MPMFRNAFEPQLKSQQFAIELLMRKKQHEEDISQQNKMIEMRKLEGEAKLKADVAKAQIEVEKEKIKFMQNMYGEAVKSSNPELAEKFGKPLDALGYPVAAEPTGMDSGSEPAPLKWLVNEKKPAPGTISPLKKLLDEKGALPPNSPLIPEYDKAISKQTGGKDTKPKDKILTMNGVAYEIIKDAEGKTSLINISGGKTGKPKNKFELTMDALSGNPESKQLLEKMADQEIEFASRKGAAGSEGKLKGLEGVMDIDGTAKAILDGRETIDNVRNTFGVPIQERVRKEVLKVEPDFNFNQPRAVANSLKSSLLQQQKNRGMMGSFVKNINGQVDRLEQISKDIVTRIGVRALDLSKRELLTRVIGSGNEQVMNAYMKEISAEISKLSSGSAASIAQLPEANRKEWEKIHDPNLSMRELLIVLNGTREMANIRLESVDDEINETIDQFTNIRTRRNETSTNKNKAPKKTEKPSNVKLDADSLIKKYGIKK